MSSVFQPSNINDRSDSSSSEGSSVGVRVVPVNEQRGNTEASSSYSEPSCSSKEKERRCIIEVRVETPLSGTYNGLTGVAVQIVQSDLHRVQICTPEGIEQKPEALNPNEDTLRVWSPENYVSWKFELEV